MEKIHFFTRNEREVLLMLLNRADKPWWLPRWVLDNLSFVHFHRGSAGVVSLLVTCVGLAILCAFLFGYVGYVAACELRGFGL
jgi:hypothetical protein